MSTSLFFNLSFDLGGISIILFVIWFFVNFHNSAAAFKWFSLSILALLASVIILSYGSTKLAKSQSSLPTQNQTEITDLKQEIHNLKSKKNSKSNDHKSKNSIQVPARIVNSNDNELIKKAVANHKHHINLVAKVTNSSHPVMVRGVHSSQIYKVNKVDNNINNGEFVIIKGTATNGENGAIDIKASSVEKQPNS